MNKHPLNFLTLVCGLVCFALASARAAVISVNLANNAGAAYIIGGGTNYGIASEGTAVAGWTNIVQPTANASVPSVSSLPYSDGTSSSVDMSGTIVGSGNFNSYNGAYGYTPCYSGLTAYTGSANYNTVILTNLAANFPNGYKVIVYVCGYLTSSAASISDGADTYYFKSYSTGPSIPSPFTPIQITSTTPGTYTLGQYAVFGDFTLLTSDSLTLTITAITGGGAGLCGFQIVGVSARDLVPAWSGAVNNNWDTTTLNWTNSIYGTTNYTEGAAVVFDDQAVPASPTVNLTAPRNPGSVTVDSTKNYTFTGSGIAGATGFTQQGSGTTTLNNVNNYTGDTIIRGGTLKLGVSGAIPSGAGNGNVSVAAGATLDLNGVSTGINGLSGTGTVDDTGAAASLTVGLDDAASQFDGTLQGATTLVKQGTNTITLTGYSYHSGGTLVQQGTLILNPASNFSSAGALAVSNGAILYLNVTNGAGINPSSLNLNGGTALMLEYGDATVSGYATPISVGGPLNLNGVSQIGISGYGFGLGTYTLISYGSKTGSGSISSTPISLPVGMVATIQDTGSAINLVVTSPSIQLLFYTYGDGGIWATNTTGYWNIGGANYAEYAGGLGDSVVFTNSYGGFKLTGGNVALPGDVHPYTVTVSGNYTLNGPGGITGSTGLQELGGAAQVFVLNNTNTYTGGTMIAGGTLQINNAQALGSGDTVVASGASLALSNNITLAGGSLTLNGNGTANNNGALRTVDPVNAVTVSAPITLGGNARIAAGPAGSRLIISAPITDNGSNYSLFAFTPSATDTLVLNSSGNQVGNLVVYGGDISFGVDDTFPTASLSVGAGFFDLNGTSQSFAGLLQGNTPENGVITNSSAITSTLTINYTNTTTSAPLQSVISGPVNIVKTGDGTQSYTGGPTIVHTYTGTTTINGGILGLASDVSQVTNRWTVNAGGTLRGIATIGGAVTVNSGGTFYAGYASNALGTLTISNNLSLAGNTIVAVNKDLSPSNDVINVSGALAYGGTLTIYNLGTNALVAGDTFTVFPPGGTGSFSSIVSEPGTTYSFNDGVLTVVSVTPPTGPTLGYTVSGGGVLQFNWTGAYKLQWQTNALATGLSTNWVDYPDTNNPVNVTNNPTIPGAFFRLISQ